MEELLTFLFFVALWLVAKFLKSAPKGGAAEPGRTGATPPDHTPDQPPPAAKREP